MTVRKFAAALLMTTALSACNAHSQYTASTPAPTLTVSVPQVSDHSAEWRPGFKALVERVLVQHPEWLAAKAGLNSAAWGVAIADSAFLPSVGLSAKGGYTDMGGMIKPSATGSVGFDASWTLIDFGAGARADAARWSALAAARSPAERLEVIALQVMEVYTDLVRHNALTQALRNAVAWHREVLETAKARASFGTGSAGDVPFIAARLAAAEIALSEAENLLADAGSRYRRVTGEEPEQQLSMPSKLPLSASEELATDPVIIGTHPTVAILGNQLEATINEMVALDLDGFGRLGIGFSGAGWSRVVGMAAVSPWTMGAALIHLDIPIADAKRRAQLAKAKAEIAVTLAKGEDTRRSVRFAVEQAYHAASAAVTQEQLSVEQATAAAKARDAYLAEYRSGNRTITELLTVGDENIRAAGKRVDAGARAAFATYRVTAAQGNLGLILGINYEAQSVKQILDLAGQD